MPVTVRVTLSGAIGFLVLAAHPVQPPAQIFATATVLAVAAEALETVLRYPGIPARWRLAEVWTPLAPVLPTRIGLGGVTLSFITMLASFGTPLDLTADNLRVECLFPADAATEGFLRQMA